MNGKYNRRKFAWQLALTSGALATAATQHASFPFVRTGPRSSRRKRVALLATEVRRHSHGQHFIDRFLEGYGWQGKWHHPEVDLVSLYVDQFPTNDLARDRAGRFGVPLFPTVEEALTRGSGKLDVDGVVIIAEHGKYARNEKGQSLYPRYEWFKKIVKVFEDAGRAVPVFNDKHLATEWAECAEMVQDSKRLGFAFLAGSSLPVTWRIPALEVPLDTPLRESLCICYGGVDSYDFHGLETVQCMSERRAGGEAGVKSLQALRGENAWEALRKNPTTKKLFLAALTRSHTLRVPSGYTYLPPDLDWMQKASPQAVAYFMEHNDGYKSSMFLCNGLLQDFTYAGLTSSEKILSCQMHLPMPLHISTTADFFNPLLMHIENLVLHKKAAYPVERTLLTSGMTLFGVESLFRGEVKLPTPGMAKVEYSAPRGSHFWRA